MKIKWISALKEDLDTVGVTQTDTIDRKTISHNHRLNILGTYYTSIFNLWS